MNEIAKFDNLQTVDFSGFTTYYLDLEKDKQFVLRNEMAKLNSLTNE